MHFSICAAERFGRARDSVSPAASLLLSALVLDDCKRHLGAALALLALSSNALADPQLAPTPTPTGEVVVKSVYDLHQHPTGGSQLPQLRHGIPANSDDWPASLYMTFDSAEGPAACTAALVGPQALLTAAHCTPASGSISFKLAHNDYTAVCESDSAYASDPSADWALCKVVPSVRSPVGLKFESVEMTPMKQLQDVPLLLGGYGCTSDQVGAGLPDDKKPTYDIGENAVAETSLSAHHKYESEFYAPSQKNNLFTDDWGSNICPGDSGGPAFRITESVGGLYEHRVIAAVNSRVFYQDPSRRTYGASILSSTGGDFGGWALGWARNQSVSICGVTPGPSASCRQ